MVKNIGKILAGKQRKGDFKSLLMMLLCCFSMSPAIAQSLIFSQYYFSPSNLNPALAGLEKDLTFGANHRSQWRDLQVPYNASLFTFTCPFFVAKPRLYHAGGVGFSVSRETAGSHQLYSSVRGQFSAAYNLRLDYENRHLLAFGLQAALVQNTIDDNHLQWGSQYNELIGYDPGISPSLGQLIERSVYPAFSTGIVWHFRANEGYAHYINKNKNKYRGYLGLSFANLNRPNTAHFTAYTHRAPLISKAIGGVEHQVRNFQLSHHALWVRAGNTYHLNFGTYVTYTLKDNYRSDFNSLSLLMGGWYRLQDAFVLSLGLKVKKISAVVSYDLNKKVMAADNTLSGGAYEVSVSYRVPRKISKKQYGIPLM